MSWPLDRGRAYRLSGCVTVSGHEAARTHMHGICRDALNVSYRAKGTSDVGPFGRPSPLHADSRQAAVCRTP